MFDFAAERDDMVRRQIAARGIESRPLLEALRAVPREAFVPEHLAALAYQDSPLPIEADQTLSQPYIVALMIEAAEGASGDKVLEIGAGSGYAAAVMGRIAEQVIAIERHAELVALAQARMEKLGYANVRIVHGDGSRGLPEEAPFHAILAAASGSHVPELLKEQLAIGGALVMPVGEPGAVQNLVKVTRLGPDDYRQEDLGAVRFVPLIGEQGWREPGAPSPPPAPPVRSPARCSRSSATPSWPSLPASGWNGSAIPMSTSSKATAPMGCRKRRRSMPSSPPPAAATCPRR